MKKMFMRLFLSVLILLFVSAGFAKGNKFYGAFLCSHPDFKCITVKSGESWQTLFPNPVTRDLIQRLNRTDMRLSAGKTLVVPNDLNSLSLLTISPFARHINETGNKIIIVDQEKLAWGAYDRNGQLVKWGPISSGKDYCPDINRSCTTITGMFYVFNKKDQKCKSNIFPVGEGGANMPYCMFFYKGYALHGSEEVRGFRDSHGCVRLFTKDAKWLNEKFVELSTQHNNFKGTKVIVQKLKNEENKDKDKE